MDAETFVNVFGGVFEDAPWVAERAWREAPFSSPVSLREALCRQVRMAGRQQQLELLCNHPELGTKQAMAAASLSEQRGAGIVDANRTTAETLARLNREYRTKFGFPYIVAVKGMDLHAILADLQERLHSDSKTEFQQGLQQVFRIAAFRLQALLAGDAP